MVKNTLYRRKNDKLGGDWKSEKASKMFANFSGQITELGNDDCNRLKTLYPNGNTDTKSSSQTYDYGVGHTFGYLNKALHSHFDLYLKSARTDSQRGVIKIHKHTCQ